MIQIDDAIPAPRKVTVHVVDGPSQPHPDDFTIELYIPLPKQARAAKIDKSTKKIMDRYAEAYQRVYGIACTIRYDKPWLQVRGIDGRFTKARLLEMARQLEYRIGE